MFSKASSFNQPLNGWDTSNVIDMSWMFNGAKSFNQPLNAWNTSNVTNMFRMFSGAESFNQPLNDWDTLSADVDKMFDQSGIDEDNYSAFVAGKVSKG